MRHDSLKICRHSASGLKLRLYGARLTAPVDIVVGAVAASITLMLEPAWTSIFLRSAERKKPSMPVRTFVTVRFCRSNESNSLVDGGAPASRAGDVRLRTSSLPGIDSARP